MKALNEQVDIRLADLIKEKKLFEMFNKNYVNIIKKS